MIRSTGHPGHRCERLDQKTFDQMGTELDEAWAAGPEAVRAWARRHHGWPVTCLACGFVGAVTGATNATTREEIVAEFRDAWYDCHACGEQNGTLVLDEDGDGLAIRFSNIERSLA